MSYSLSSSLEIQIVSVDGNSNVVGEISTSNGLLTASYEYGPFGEMLQVLGPSLLANDKKLRCRA